MDKCVHCGFCLATCPSYLLLGQEMDSPRGRIYLMRAGVEGACRHERTFVGHFDTCLGCMACETACPSGVRYAPLIEDTRAVIEQHHERPLGGPAVSHGAVPGPAVSGAAAAARLAARRRSTPPPHPRPHGASSASAPESADARAGRRLRDARRPPRSRRPRGAQRKASASSPAASSACSSATSMRRPSGSWPPKAATCSRQPPRDAAARSRSTPAATTTPARSPVS